MRRAFAIVGLALQVLVGVFPYSASGLMAPLYGLAVLFLIWLGGLVLAIRLYRIRSPWTPAVPVVSVALWFLVMTVGEAWLGWTA